MSPRFLCFLHSVLEVSFRARAEQLLAISRQHLDPRLRVLYCIRQISGLGRASIASVIDYD
jgi:hypothetical protein